MNKIIKKLNEKYKFMKKSQIVCFFVYICFFAYLIMQHRLIGMYYDDFGNASLSYGYDSTAIVGTSYTIKDILLWAKYIYFNWGGRIVYALLLIPLLKSGVHLFMFIQAVVIIIIMYFMIRLVKIYNSYANELLIMLCFMLGYGLLRGDILTMGIYWASASVLYVWPMIFFFGSILLYYEMEQCIEKGEKPKKHIWCTIIFFIPLITLSQEQIGGAFIVWLFFHIIFQHWKIEKLYWKIDVPIILYSLITFAVQIAAPGNWVRLNTNKDYVELSLIKRIEENIPKVFDLLTNDGIKFFNFYLIVIGCWIVVLIKNNIHKWYLWISIVGIIPFAVVDILYIIKKNTLGSISREISFAVFLVDMFFLLIVYLKQKKQIKLLALMISGVSSVFCLVFSPNFAMRSCIPYIFICFILGGVVIVDGLSANICEKNIKRFLCMILLLLSGIAIVSVNCIYRGYEENYYMDNYNFQLLKNYNGKGDTIYLIKYANNIYRAQMSCDNGFENIDYWIREYYNIPHNVKIKWKTQEELLMDELKNENSD